MRSDAGLRQFIQGTPPPTSRPDPYIERPTFNAGIKASATKRLEAIDKLKPELRDAVHRHGFPIVKAFMDCGIKRANQIDHLVALIRHETPDGRPADFGNRRPGKKD